MTTIQLVKQEDVVKIQQEAENVVRQLQTTSQTQMDQIIDQLGNLGESTQRNAAESLEILKRPVKDLMDGKNNDIPNALLKLRECTEELNPSKILQSGGISSFFNRLMGKNPISTYIRKYESVSTQIDNIITALLHGSEKLKEDVIHLKHIKNKANENIYELEKRIYFGNKLLEMLEAESKKPENLSRKSEFEKAMVKVVSRVRNMSQMVNILQQSIASVDVIVENNEKLDEAVFNAITMTQNVVTVSAAIQLALNNQKKVIEAVQGTNQAIEDMLLANAQSLKNNTQEITTMLEQPSIALNKLKQAFDDVFAAIQITEESNRRIIESGKSFIQEMDKLNSDMRVKLGMTPHQLAAPGNQTTSLLQ
jgi:uncharacterized protein YaaN involved in tellurite resistance